VRGIALDPKSGDSGLTGLAAVGVSALTMCSRPAHLQESAAVLKTLPPFAVLHRYADGRTLADEEKSAAAGEMTIPVVLNGDTLGSTGDAGAALVRVCVLAENGSEARDFVIDSRFSPSVCCQQLSMMRCAAERKPTGRMGGQCDGRQCCRIGSRQRMETA
jgi:hypothetical protein